MEKIFWVEARKYQVLPLDATVATRLVTRPARALPPAATCSRIPESSPAPRTAMPEHPQPSYNFKAEVEVPAAGPKG